MSDVRACVYYRRSILEESIFTLCSRRSKCKYTYPSPTCVYFLYGLPPHKTPLYLMKKEFLGSINRHSGERILRFN